MAQPDFFTQGERILVVEDESIVALDLTGSIRVRPRPWLRETAGSAAYRSAREVRC